MLNPLAIGLSYKEMLAMIERALTNLNMPDATEFVEVQVQIDTGYLAIALRTRWRNRSIFSAQRTGSLGELTHKDTVILCVNEAEIPFLQEGGQWDDMGWKKLREFSWSMFIKFMENLLIEIHEQLSAYRLKSQEEKGFSDLQAKMIFNLIFIGDPMWIPKEFTNIIVGKTSELYS